VTSSEYLHGTTGAEQARLGLLNRILNPRTIELVELAPGSRVIDFGAGTGIFARELARSASGVQVVAIERDPAQIQAARALAHAADEPQLVDFRQGDALEPPLADDEWGTFDLVHARFLLEHLPDPVAAVRVMLRSLRPGGRLVLVDDDHSLLRLTPDLPAVSALWETYAAQYAAVGNDPHVGRNLASIVHAAGGRSLRNSLVFFGGVHGQELFPDVVENLAGVIESCADRIVAGGGLSRAEFERTLASLGPWSARPDAAVWYSLPWLLAEKPKD